MPKGKEDKEDNVTYLSQTAPDPWIEDLDESRQDPSRPTFRYVHGPFHNSYWYETLVEDMPAQVAFFFAHAQWKKTQDRFREHPPELIIQELIQGHPDLDEIREEMDYYDYANFKSGRYGN